MEVVAGVAGEVASMPAPSLADGSDPALREDFATVPLPLDVAQQHTYSVDWRPGALALCVDGDVVGRVEQAPDYPVQLMLGVFDFPARAIPGDTVVPIPEMVVAHVHGSAD